MKGLSFSQEMMVAWLEGRKSITRRLMNPQPGFWVAGLPYRGDIGDSDHDIEIKPRYLPGETVYISPFPVLRKQCPDMIYHKCGTGPGEISDFNCYHDKFKGDTGGYVPCRRLDCPHSHALIVSVRPEQLNSMSELDVVKEGVDTLWEKNQWCWVYMLKKLDK